MRLLIFFLIFLQVLSACAASDQRGSLSPTIAPAKPSLETSLLVTEWRGSTEGNALFPLDPDSGTALPGYMPLSLGPTSSHAFSPDRRTLVVVSYPNENNTYNGDLLLIDLRTWKTQRFELELKGWVTTMSFSPDGKRLAIAHGESRYTLTIVNLELGIITSQRQTDSFVTRLKFTENGKALMLYSPTINIATGLNAGLPKALLFDVTDLSLLWIAELKGVRDGIFPKDANVTPTRLYEPRQSVYFSPGLAFAPDGDLLYIVHADAEQLTTVDFGRQEAGTVEIQAKLSWFERLLSLTADTAHAKIADGTSRQAVISPDGQFLYVTGVNHASFQDQQGNWQTKQSLLGLEMIKTSDGSRVEHIETDAVELSLSPDGRFLYLRNWDQDTPWTEIFDTSNRQIIARKERLFATPALLMNGEALLVSTYSTSETSHHMSVLQLDGSSVLSEWTDSEGIWWLTP